MSRFGSFRSRVVTGDPDQSGKINSNKCSQTVYHPFCAHDASFGESENSLTSGFLKEDDAHWERYDSGHDSRSPMTFFLWNNSGLCRFWFQNESISLHLNRKSSDWMSSSVLWFTVGNILILPAWGLIVLFPRFQLTEWVFARDRLSPLHLLALFYALAVVPGLFSSPEALAALARPTLEGVKGLLGSDAGAAAGWIHYLCFDLYVGVAVWRSARERNFSFWWVSPLLGLVLFFGPLGWLSYELLSRVVSWRKN
jgi:hypothetical protein